MELADLVDLEACLVADEEARREGVEGRRSLARRDAAIGRKIVGDHGEDATVLRRRVGELRAARQAIACDWLEEMRQTRKDLPGRRLSEGLDVAGFVLTLVGVLVGIGAARAFLAYDGREPVNVFGFLALFCGLQVLLLLGTAWALAGRGSRGPRTGRLTGALARLARMPVLDRFVGGRRAQLEAGLGRALGRRTLYRDVEQWLLFSHAQRFGTWFNLAVIATFLYLLTFTDLAFGWSTTFSVDGDGFHRATTIVSLPWAAFASGAVPGQDLVELTRWARDGGGGWVVESEGVRPVGAWWSFLLLALLVWGLLPRAVAWLFARRKLRASLAGSALDHAAFERLFDRLLGGATEVGWATPDAETVGRAAPRRTPATGVPEHRSRTTTSVQESPPAEPAPVRTLPVQESAPVDAAPAAVAATPESVSEVPSEPVAPAISAPPTGRTLVTWGRFCELQDAEVSTIGRAIGQPDPGQRLRAGDDLRVEEEDLQRLSGARTDDVQVLVESGVQPTREVLRYLERLRETLPPPGRVTVWLLARDESGDVAACPAHELEQWQMRLDVEGDLYVRIETLGEEATS